MTSEHVEYGVDLDKLRFFVAQIHNNEQSRVTINGTTDLTDSYTLSKSDTNSAEAPDEWPLDDLLGFYIFAHNRGLKMLEEDVLNVWRNQEIESSVCLISLHIVIQTWDQLPSDSTLCQFLVKYFALYWHPDEENLHYQRYSPNLPHDFLLQVLIWRSKRLYSALKHVEESLPQDYAEFDAYWRRLR